MTTEANTVLSDEQLGLLIRAALVMAQRVCHARFCDSHPMGQAEVCKTTTEAIEQIDALCQTVKALRAKHEQLIVTSGEWARLLDRIRAWSKCDDGYPLDEHINNITVNNERCKAKAEESEAIAMKTTGIEQNSFLSRAVTFKDVAAELENLK